MIKTALSYVISFAIIFLCLFIGNQIHTLTQITIPGSIIGMLLLFLLLASGLLKIEWIRPGADLFLRYMMFLFIPISVGLMNNFDILIDNAVPIVASTIGASFIVLVVLGLILDRFLKKGE